MDKIIVKVGLEKTEFLKDGVPFGSYPTEDVTVLVEADVETETGRTWVNLKNVCILDYIPVEEGGKA